MSGRKKHRRHRYNTRGFNSESEDSIDAVDAMPRETPAGADGGTPSPNPTTADLMKAITTLQETVEAKLANISTTMTAVQASLSTVTGKVRDIEVAVTRHDDELQTQDAVCKSLQANYDELRKKVLQLESYSRRQNIRITSVSEAEGKNNPSEFVSNLIPLLLGAEHFPDGVLIDVAHRVGPKPAKGGYPRALIAKVHYLHVKTLITKLASQKAPLQYNNARVSIFPDIPTEVFQQRKKFYDVRGRCRAARLQSGFVGTRQTCLRITHNGETRYFDEPESAGRFLDARLDAVVQGDVVDDGGLMENDNGGEEDNGGVEDGGIEVNGSAVDNSAAT